MTIKSHFARVKNSFSDQVTMHWIVVIIHFFLIFSSLKSLRKMKSPQATWWVFKSIVYFVPAMQVLQVGLYLWMS